MQQTKADPEQAATSVAFTGYPPVTVTSFKLCSKPGVTWFWEGKSDFKRPIVLACRPSCQLRSCACACCKTQVRGGIPEFPLHFSFDLSILLCFGVHLGKRVDYWDMTTLYALYPGLVAPLRGGRRVGRGLHCYIASSGFMVTLIRVPLGFGVISDLHRGSSKKL